MASRPPAQFVLPLFDVFVFVDWFGTLSSARFWEDITGNHRHPLSAPLRVSLEELFMRRREFVRSWMRADVSEAEVIESLKISLPSGYKDDYLCRALLRACRRSAIDSEMSALVRVFKNHAFVAVASDNMDCFLRATPAVLSGELQIDELLVSSAIGVLKSEDPDAFFGPTLEQYSLDPANAVLIDDSLETCERFTQWGGHAFHFTDVHQLRSDLARRWRGVSRTSGHLF